MNSKLVPAALAGYGDDRRGRRTALRSPLRRPFRGQQGLSHRRHEEPAGVLWVGLAHVPFGILLALVVSWRGATSAKGGAVTGATLGFLMAAGYDLSQYGTTNPWTLNLTHVEPFISMVLVGTGGAVVGIVLGRGRPQLP